MSSERRGRQSRRGARGYTLVELLVVAAIVAALLGLSTLAWRNDPGRVLERQAQQLAGQIELALARAQLGSDRFALSLTTEGYGFWRRDAAGHWRAIEPGTGLDPVRFAPGIRLVHVHAQGMPVALGQRLALSGQTPVAIALDAAGLRAVVASGDFAGRIDVRLGRGPG